MVGVRSCRFSVFRQTTQRHGGRPQVLKKIERTHGLEAKHGDYRVGLRPSRLMRVVYCNPWSIGLCDRLVYIKFEPPKALTVTPLYCAPSPSRP